MFLAHSRHSNGGSYYCHVFTIPVNNGRISILGILGCICLRLLCTLQITLNTNTSATWAGPSVVPRAGLGPPLGAGHNTIHCL